MSLLLRLYPREWRERYGDELAFLLSERPASLSDRVDLLRGALDAHRHPLATATDDLDLREVPMSRREFGALAVIGGLAWLGGVISILVLPRMLNGDPETNGEPDITIARIGVALGTLLIILALGELGTRSSSTTSRRTGHLIAISGAVLGAMVLGEWPLFMAGLLGFPVLAVIAAGRGVLNHALSGRLGAVFAVAAVTMTIGLLGINSGPLWTVALALVGPAAIALGAQTFRDPAEDPETAPM